MSQRYGCWTSTHWWNASKRHITGYSASKQCFEYSSMCDRSIGIPTSWRSELILGNGSDGEVHGVIIPRDDGHKLTIHLADRLTRRTGSWWRHLLSHSSYLLSLRKCTLVSLEASLQRFVPELRKKWPNLGSWRQCSTKLCFKLTVVIIIPSKILPYSYVYSRRLAKCLLYIPINHCACAGRWRHMTQVATFNRVDRAAFTVTKCREAPSCTGELNYTAWGTDTRTGCGIVGTLAPHGRTTTQKPSFDHKHFSGGLDVRSWFVPGENPRTMHSSHVIA